MCGCKIQQGADTALIACEKRSDSRQETIGVVIHVLGIGLQQIVLEKGGLKTARNGLDDVLFVVCGEEGGAGEAHMSFDGFEQPLVLIVGAKAGLEFALIEVPGAVA